MMVLTDDEAFGLAIGFGSFRRGLIPEQAPDIIDRVPMTLVMLPHVLSEVGELEDEFLIEQFSGVADRELIRDRDIPEFDADIVLGTGQVLRETREIAQRIQR